MSEVLDLTFADDAVAEAAGSDSQVLPPPGRAASIVRQRLKRSAEIRLQPPPVIRTLGSDIGTRRLGLCVVEGREGQITGHEMPVAWEVIDLETTGKQELALVEAVEKTFEARPQFTDPAIAIAGIEKQPHGFTGYGKRGNKRGNKLMWSVSVAVGAVLRAGFRKHNRPALPVCHYASASNITNLIRKLVARGLLVPTWQEAADVRVHGLDVEEDREGNKERNVAAADQWVRRIGNPVLTAFWEGLGGPLDGQRDAADAFWHAMAMLEKGRAKVAIEEAQNAAAAAATTATTSGKKHAQKATAATTGKKPRKPKAAGARPPSIGTPLLPKGFFLAGECVSDKTPPSS